MIVLHAAQVAHELFLWAERPVEPATSAPRKRARASKTTRANPLPFDAGPKAIAEALRDVLPDALCERAGDSVRLTAWLPACGGQPVASTPIIAEPPPEGSEIAMSGWTVEACRLSPARAVTLLGECIDRETLGPGILIGRDLRFWAKTLRFASALAMRQQFLPGLSRLEGGWYARWEPVLAGADAARSRKLAAVMPHSARALSSEPTAPPSIPATAVLGEFLTTAVDYIVRSGLSGAPATPTPPPKGRRSFDSLHDQWIHALRAGDGFMPNDTAELEKLAGEIRSWRLPLQMTGRASQAVLPTRRTD